MYTIFHFLDKGIAIYPVQNPTDLEMLFLQACVALSNEQEKERSEAILNIFGGK